MRERVDLKSPVRENRPPGSVRGAPGNRRPYRDIRITITIRRRGGTGSLGGVAIVEPAFGRDVAAEVEIHDVARMLQVVGPFEVEGERE